MCYGGVRFVGCTQQLLRTQANVVVLSAFITVFTHCRRAGDNKTTRGGEIVCFTLTIWLACKARCFAILIACHSQHDSRRTGAVQWLLTLEMALNVTGGEGTASALQAASMAFA